MDPNDQHRLNQLRDGINRAPAQFVNILTEDAKWLVELATANQAAQNGGATQHEPPERLET